MPRYQRYQQDDDNEDDQQPDQQDQQQDDEDDNNNDNENESQRDQTQQDQTQQQQQGDEGDDDDDNNNTNARGGEVHDDDDDNNNAGRRGQPQPQDDDDDDADDEQRGKASQQQDDDEDAGNTRRGLQQADDDDNDEGRTKAQDDDDDDDEQKASKSSNVYINFNIQLGGNLEDSELHEGGIMFSKKLLAQLFSGPGEHDPDEKEVPVHQIQHEHMETADSGEWTIVELKTQDAKGATMYLKAKLDSGADDNFMSFGIFEVTDLDFTPYEGPEGPPPSFTMGGGQQSQPSGTVRLEYTAGKKPQKFIETFQVLEGLPHDVVIGKPLMTAAHMMMVNPNFANPPDHPALCLMELRPKDKDSKAKAEAFQKQRVAEQAAAYEAKLKAQGA